MMICPRCKKEYSNKEKSCECGYKFTFRQRYNISDFTILTAILILFIIIYAVQNYF